MKITNDTIYTGYVWVNDASNDRKPRKRKRKIVVPDATEAWLAKLESDKVWVPAYEDCYTHRSVYTISGGLCGGR